MVGEEEQNGSVLGALAGGSVEWCLLAALGHLFRRKEEKEALWRRGEAVRNGSGADVISPEKGEK
ncbi:hypothetical protein KY284_010544 [Solanum tuberosum]|nr:hypothetical protein KY284_010544 [Solanum tuberosum]